MHAGGGGQRAGGTLGEAPVSAENGLPFSTYSGQRRIWAFFTRPLEKVVAETLGLDIKMESVLTDNGKEYTQAPVPSPPSIPLNSSAKSMASSFGAPR